MLSRNEIFGMYKLFCVCDNRPGPFEETEEHFLQGLKLSMQTNPLAAHRYFHYTGFVAGVSSMFAKIGGEVENSNVSERLVDYYVGPTEL